MVKVRLLTGVGAAVLAIPAVGCAVDHQEDVASDSANQTESDPGSGSLALHSYAMNYGSTSGGDEFLRVGEKLKASLSFDDALDMLYVGDAGDQAAIAALRADPSKLKLSLKVSYTKFDETKIDAPALPVTFAAGAGGVLAGTSEEFAVPKGTKALHAEFSAEYEKDGAPATRELLSTHGIQSNFTVFGGFAPDKLALFDSLGSDFHTRIVEGGGVVKGAHLTLSITDYRLDTVIDKTSLDLRIGRRNSYSRFGASVIDALGSIEYVVGAAYSTDGGASYQGMQMQKVTGPDTLSRQQWRFAYQNLLNIPADAGPNVKVAFHVQAYLVVPSYYPGEIFDARYQPGQRSLLKDAWDSANGANYTLPIASQ